MELYNHQKEALEFLKKRWYNGALFMDCGLGKSRCIIELLKLQHLKTKIRVLIVAPVSVIASWIDEIAKWAKFKHTIITNPENIELNNDMFFISYDRVYRYIDKLLTINFSHLIIDESSKIKNITTKRFKSLIKLAKKTNHRFILTGTPIANSLMDLYTQILILDFGKRLSSYINFRSKYFFKTDKFNYKEKFGAKERVFYALRDIVFSKKSTDLIDQTIYIINKKVEFYSEQKHRYDKIINEMKKVRNLLLRNRYLFFKYVYKLLEICSGFMIETQNLKQGKSSIVNSTIEPLKQQDQKLSTTKTLSEQNINYCGSNKSEMLENILFEISSKTIIFHNFIEEGNIVKNILRKTQTNFLEISSQMKIEERIKILQQFKSDNTKILIMNVRIGGFGLNLGFCQNVIFFSPPIFSMETYKQAIDRIHRVDSIYKSAFVFRIQVKNSLEEYVYKVIEHKGELLDSLYEFFGFKQTNTIQNQ